jgi:HAD superfamily hydrolase (TIGR01450 family)
MTDLDLLPASYRTVLCDLWGCVHDGHRVLPGVIDRLERWKGEGRRVLFLTNAPRSGDAVQLQLDRLGLPPGLHSGILTAGGAGVTHLLGRPVGFLGTPEDRADLEGRGLRFIDSGYDELACAGLEADRLAVSDYETQLAAWRADDVLMHCLNPDRIVHHMGAELVCAGALADRYQAMGGRTAWYGKPFPAIYDQAIAAAGDPPRDQVVAVGDGLHTDVLGAARAGIACVYLTGGISRGQGVPPGFNAAHGLGDWTPLIVASGL